jgi:hypothetical protein
MLMAETRLSRTTTRMKTYNSRLKSLPTMRTATTMAMAMSG